MHTKYLTFNDIPAIIDLAKVAVQDIKYWDRIDVDVLDTSLRTMIHHPDFFCRGYYDDKGVFVGAMCGRITRQFFNTDMCAEGVALFILPNARGRGGAVRLYQEFTDWAKGFKRVKHISLRTTSGLDLTKIITRLGYKSTGFTYRLEL